nr:hypothetical protein [Tanacetum cinerariifolium]
MKKVNTFVDFRTELVEESSKKAEAEITQEDKATLKEYDQKRAIYQTMHENKSFNKNPANHRLYHALMEALIEDEKAMGKKTKRRRTKESKSSKKPSTTKETPKGKALSKVFKTGKSASAKEPVEEPITKVVMDDASEDVPWYNQMVSAIKDHLTFNDLMATLIVFSKYVLNQLKIDNLTQDLLLGPAYNLLKGTCTSSIKLEYNFQECFNALTIKLDWKNPEGDPYPFDIFKPLPLQGHPGHLTVDFDYFFNNDLEYLKYFDPEKTYTISITKTKETRYEIVEVVVKRVDRQLYKFKEGDFVDLYLNNIKDMLILAIQQKLFHLNDSDIVDFIVALRMFTRSLVIKRRVKDLQLGVESY